jgi:hypothetical protein
MTLETFYIIGVPAFDYFFTLFVFLTIGFIGIFAAMSLFRS